MIKDRVKYSNSSVFSIENIRVECWVKWNSFIDERKNKAPQMNPKNSNEMDTSDIKANYVYLFHIIISIIFILCFEFLFSWRKQGEWYGSGTGGDLSLIKLPSVPT